MEEITVSKSPIRYFLDTYDYERINAFTTDTPEVVWTIPPYWAVNAVHVIKVVEFDDGGTEQLTIDVGTTAADPDEFVDALDLAAAGVGTLTRGTSGANGLASSDDIYVDFTGTSVGGLTAGECKLVFEIIDYSRLVY